MFRRLHVAPQRNHHIPPPPFDSLRSLMAGRVVAEYSRVEVRGRLGPIAFCEAVEGQFISRLAGSHFAALRLGVHQYDVHARMLDLKQSFTEAFSHHMAGRLGEAEAGYRQILAEHPNMPDPLHLLGAIALQRGDVKQALELVGRAIAIDATVPNYHNSLGLALIAAGQFQDAAISLQEALRLAPQMSEAYANLGLAYQRLTLLDESIAAFGEALRLNPNDAEGLNNLGNSLRVNGQIDQAIEAYRRAIAIDPSSATRHSNLVYTLQFHPGYDGHAILQEHRNWAQRHAEPLKRFIQPHRNDRDPDRALRIGYVSADFHTTVLAQFFYPLLKLRDRTNFHAICYSNTPTEDPTTDQLRELADGWHHIFAMSDEQVTELIRKDRIDILVDLTAHASGNRLLVFARRPAPVQVTYLSYPGTTGLDTIDYRITDPYLDPPGTSGALYSEQSFRLPKTYWCYQPLGSTIDPGTLPLLSAGQVTFGCLNGFGKVSKPALETWARLLAAVPNSRLILHSYDGSCRERVGDLFGKHGVNPERISFLGFMTVNKYFYAYERIDIALDPFPYNGGTTTCDALWMGVPVVSLAGQIAVHRAGTSILSNIGLRELVASSTDEYLQIATALTRDNQRLIQLRQSTRQQMKASPLMDPQSFTRDMEAAYRQMWRKYVSEGG